MWSQRMLADENFTRNLEVVNSSQKRPSRERKSLNSVQCPTFDKAYLDGLRQNGYDHPMNLSLSPWKLYIDQHPQR